MRFQGLRRSPLVEFTNRGVTNPIAARVTLPQERYSVRWQADCSVRLRRMEMEPV
jgi:hypothetical protein